jgi:hypothetical protein
MEYLVVGCRCLVGLVFVASTAGKLRGVTDFRRFLVSLRKMGVPPRWARPLGAAVVAFEIVIVVLVATPSMAGFGLALAAALLVAFTAAIGAALRRGVREPCRCFGNSKTPLGASHVARNLALGGMAALGAVGSASETALPLHSGGVALAVACGVVFAGLTVVFDDLVALFSTKSATPTSGRSGWEEKEWHS